MKRRPVSEAPSWRTRNVWVFSFASLFSDWGHEMVTALLPGFLTLIGAPVIALGVIEGVSNLAQSWAALWGGRVNDQYQSRHILLIWGYILTGLKALVAMVSWWPWVVVIRTIGWMGRGARGPIRDAYLAEEVPAQHVGKAYGMREAFDTAGAILGPFTAAVLVSFISPRTLIAWTAIPAVLTIIVIVRVRKMHPLHLPEPDTRGQTSRAWSPEFRRYRMATTIFTMGYLAPTFFILRVWYSGESWNGVPAHTIALLLYTLHNVVYALSAYPIGRLADRAISRMLLLVGYGLWMIAMVGFAINGSGLGSWMGLFAISGLATAIIEVEQKMATVHLVPDAMRGKGLGQIAALRGLGQLVASMLMGIIWTMGLPVAGFLAEAALAGVGLISMVGVQGKPRTI